MNNFKFLLDTLKPGGMDELGSRYYGFYRFANMMTRLAEGLSAGVIEVPKDEDINIYPISEFSTVFEKINKDLDITKEQYKTLKMIDAGKSELDGATIKRITFSSEEELTTINQQFSLWIFSIVGWIERQRNPTFFAKII